MVGRWKMKALGWIVCLGGLGAVMLGCMGTESGPVAIGKHAPEIEGADSNGRSFKLSDYRGKVVLLDFWKHD
jgi:hypothetical protein